MELLFVGIWTTLVAFICGIVMGNVIFHLVILPRLAKIREEFYREWEENKAESETSTFHVEQ